jgi:hypothetical protein
MPLLTVANISKDNVPKGRIDICTVRFVRIMMIIIERWKLIGSLYHSHE